MYFEIGQSTAAHYHTWRGSGRTCHDLLPNKYTARRSESATIDHHHSFERTRGVERSWRDGQRGTRGPRLAVRRCSIAHLRNSREALRGGRNARGRARAYPGWEVRYMWCGGCGVRADHQFRRRGRVLHIPHGRERGALRAPTSFPDELGEGGDVPLP